MTTGGRAHAHSGLVQRFMTDVEPIFNHRSTPVELLQRPARRRRLVWRLCGATDLPALSQDGRRAGARAGKKSAIPQDLSWSSLLRLDGDALEGQYLRILKELGQRSGLIGVIFRKARNRIQDPAKLRRLVEMIDGETWTGLDIDIKGDIYEGLLEKNAQDIKSGAGQYFTPRPLIKAMVDVMRPQPGQTIADPACGTGGFLLAVHDHVVREHGPLDRDQWDHLRHKALHGWEIVDNTARLCVMNLYLHGIGANGGTSPSGGGESPIRVADSLAADPGLRFSLVLTPSPPSAKRAA